MRIAKASDTASSGGRPRPIATRSPPGRGRAAPVILPPSLTLPHKGRGDALRRETKFAAADLAVGVDGVFSGYASLFNEADLSRDMVMPGAFRASLRKRGAGGVRMLFQHDPALPIGVWEEVREDSHGLFVRGRLTTEVAKAREVLALMRAGAIDGLSIGFRTVRGRSDAKTGIRKLLEVDLWEISVVTFPLLPAARVSSVKGARTVVAAVRDAARKMRAVTA